MTEEQQNHEDFTQLNEDTLIDKIFKNRKRILITGSVLAVCIWIMSVKERTLYDNIFWVTFGLMFIGFPVFSVFAYLKYRKDEKAGKERNIFSSHPTIFDNYAAKLAVIVIIFPVVYLHSAEIISINLACLFYFLFFCSLLYLWYKS